MTDIEGPALMALKIFVLVGIGTYAIFAAVMVQQSRLMSNVLEKAYQAPLTLLALLHLSLATGLFFLALLIL